MILETVSLDGEWAARQVDDIAVTRQGVILAGRAGEMGMELKPDDYVLIEALTDTRQPLRMIVDTRRVKKDRAVARSIRNLRPNHRTRFVSPPEEE